MAGPKFCYNVGELQLRGAIQYPVKMAISWPFIICFKHIQWVIIVLTAEEKNIHCSLYHVHRTFWSNTRKPHCNVLCVYKHELEISPYFTFNRRNS